MKNATSKSSQTRKAPTISNAQCILMLKALADQYRWELVRLLLNRPTRAPLTVGEIAAQLKVPQPNISKQLTHLKKAGIVTTQRLGKQVHVDVSPTFRVQLGRKKTLDLGCCVFDFSAVGRKTS